MRLLALETSGVAGSVAALDGEQLKSEVAIEPNKRSAQALAPAIKTVLERAGWSPHDVQVVAVVTGPGSFTGLRIGVTTAKTFAYAVKADAIGVNTFEVIAAQVPALEAPGRICVVLDAGRGQVYTQTFAVLSSESRTGEPHSGESLVSVSGPSICDSSDWLAGLKPLDRASGPALKTLYDRLPPGVVAAPEDCWWPRASTVGRLAAARYAAGQRDDLLKLVPLYLRRSAAEEKREA